MSKNTSVIDVAKVNENQLPSIISTQFNKLTELENNVQKAVNMAAAAKEKAKDAKVSAGWFKKKTAIEALQDAAEGSADALITMAEAQKLSFEYQTKLTEITKYLFGLGVSNIAMNRSVVRELELRLKGASEDDISELAQQELRNVILQLKSQEDIMKKQEFLTGKVKEQAGQIIEIDRQIEDMEASDNAQNERIEENAEKISKNAQNIDELERQDVEQDRRLDEGEQKDIVQDAQIIKNAQDIDKLEQQDVEHDRRLDEGEQKDKDQDAQISENAQDIDELERQDEEQDKLICEGIEKDKEQDRAIEQIQDTNDKQNEFLTRQQEKIDLLQNKIDDLESMLATKGNKILLIATSVTSVMALIISIVQFFI